MLLPPILGLIPKEHYCFNLGTSQINYFYKPNVSLIQIGTQLIRRIVKAFDFYLILRKIIHIQQPSYYIFNSRIITYFFKSNDIIMPQ